VVKRWISPRRTVSAPSLFPLSPSSALIRVSAPVLPFTANGVSTRDDFSPEGTNLAAIRYAIASNFQERAVDPVSAAKMERRNFICAYRHGFEIFTLNIPRTTRSIKLSYFVFRVYMYIYM
jgi:hypothetical protein